MQAFKQYAMALCALCALSGIIELMLSESSLKKGVRFLQGIAAAYTMLNMLRSILPFKV